MKKLILLSLVVWDAACGQGISFRHESLAVLRTAAAKENKLIFVDAYTSWCGPCKTMARNVFTDSAVADFYNARFVNAKIDMEKGEGPAISNQYSVGCYPSFLFLDSALSLVHRGAGYMEAEEFIRLGERALLPEETYAAAQKSYAEGQRDPGFILRFMKQTRDLCLPANVLALDYLRGMTEQDLLKAHNWAIFDALVDDPASEPFRKVREKRGFFAGRLGEERVDGKILTVYHDAANALIYGEAKVNEPALKALRAEVASTDFTRKEELGWMIDLAYYHAIKDWNRYFLAGKNLLEKYRASDMNLLNNTSYTIYEHSYNKEQLAEAEEWARRSVEIEEAPFNLDTYAALLSRNGKKQRAIEVQKKAIALARAQGEDTGAYEEMLKKIENR